MLHRRPNSRQIPDTIEYTADKRYHDLVYGYLQSISLLGKNEIRYVRSTDVNFVKIGLILGMDRRVVKKYFTSMQEMFLIGFNEDKRYELLILANEYASLVPLDVLIALVKTKVHRIISAYVMFLRLALKADIEGQIEYNLTTIKRFVGLSGDTYSNSKSISEAMDILQNLKLVEHRQDTFMKEGKVITSQYVKNISNEIVQKA